MAVAYFTETGRARRDAVRCGARASRESTARRKCGQDMADAGRGPCERCRRGFLRRDRRNNGLAWVVLGSAYRELARMSKVAQREWCAWCHFKGRLWEDEASRYSFRDQQEASCPGPAARARHANATIPKGVPAPPSSSLGASSAANRRMRPQRRAGSRRSHHRY